MPCRALPRPAGPRRPVADALPTPRPAPRAQELELEQDRQQQDATSAALQQLLKKLRRGSNLADVSHTVFQLVELLLGSQPHVREFVRQGGIRALLAVVPKLNHELQLNGNTSQVLQASMQISWALIAVANESTPEAECPVLGRIRTQLVDDGAVVMLGPLLKALLLLGGQEGAAAERQQPGTLQPVLRNLCMLLFKLCDGGHNEQPAEQDRQSAAAAEAMQAMGLLPALQQLYSGDHSSEPAVWAAATLAAICQRQLLEPAAAEALLHDMASGGGVRALCTVLWAAAHQPQHAPLLQRCSEVLHGLVHFLLERRFEPFLEAVVTEHLGACLLSALPQSLARHVLLSLLSSRGQGVMAGVEAAWECDVPLLLAQLLPLPELHMALPPPAGAAPGAPPTYTDQQICRMLLVRRQLGALDSRAESCVRLEELLAAFFEELAECGEGGGEAALQSEVVLAVQALVAFLMGQALDLQQLRQARGAAVEASTTSGGSRSSIEAALDSEHGALYAQVLAAALGAQQRGGEAQREQQQQQQQQPGGCTVVVPDPQAGGCEAAVTFDCGDGEAVVVSRRCFRLLKDSSSMVGSVLKRADTQRSIALLRVPRFTAQANAWVLQCAARWLLEPEALALEPAEALRLWPAADFLQLESLQARCEDVVAARFGAEPALLERALELCCWHADSSSRLLHLATMHAMRELAPLLRSGALARLAGVYRRQFGGCFFDELRDRLVAFLALDAGAVAEPEVTSGEGA